MPDTSIPPTSTNNSKTDFGVIFIILLIGLLSWIGISIVSSGDQVNSMVLMIFDSLNNAWQNAFISSFIIVVVLALVTAVARNWAPETTLKVVAYYGISPFLFLVAKRIYNWIYFNQAQNNEAAGLFGVTIIIFYILGLFLALGCNGAKRKDSLEAFFLLPLMGTLLLIIYTGWGLFTSPEFIYRDAFVFNIKKVQQQNGVVTADVVLKLKKAGDYTFTTDYVDPMMREPGVPSSKAEIVWEKKGVPREVGEYPLHITANSGDNSTSANGNNTMSPEAYGRDRGGNLYFQISLLPKSNNNKTYQTLKTFIISPSSPKNLIVQ